MHQKQSPETKNKEKGEGKKYSKLEDQIPKFGKGENRGEKW